MAKMKDNRVTIMITRPERELILRYGYPFDEIEHQLKEAGDVDLSPVTDDPYWWEQVMANLSISAKENEEVKRDKELVSALRSLIERIAEELGMP